MSNVKHIIRVNPRGLQGRKGDKGNDGFSPIISVINEPNSTSFRLRIENINGVIYTPPVTSIEFIDNGGSYIRRIDGVFELTNADSASTNQQGEVMLATNDDIDSLNNSKAVTPKLLVEYTQAEVEDILNEALPNNGYRMRGSCIKDLETQSALPPTGSENDFYLITGSKKQAVWTTSHWEITDINDLQNGDLWKIDSKGNAIFYLFDNWYYLGGQVVETSEGSGELYRVGVQDVILALARSSDYAPDGDTIAESAIYFGSAMLWNQDVSPEEADYLNKDILCADILVPVEANEGDPAFLYLANENYRVADLAVFGCTVGDFPKGESICYREDLLVTREFSEAEVIEAIRILCHQQNWYYRIGTDHTSRKLFLQGKSSKINAKYLDIQWRNNYVVTFNTNIEPLDGTRRGLLTKNAIAYLLGDYTIDYTNNTFPDGYYNRSREFKARDPFNPTQKVARINDFETGKELRKPWGIVRPERTSANPRYVCKKNYNDSIPSLQDVTPYFSSGLFYYTSSTYDLDGENLNTYGRVMLPAHLTYKRDMVNVSDLELIKFIQDYLTRITGYPCNLYEDGFLHPVTPITRFHYGFGLHFNMSNKPNYKADNGNNLIIDLYSGDGVVCPYDDSTPISLHSRNDTYLGTIKGLFSYEEYFETIGYPTKGLSIPIGTVVSVNPPRSGEVFCEAVFDATDLNFNIYNNTGGLIPPEDITINSVTGSNSDSDSLIFSEYKDGKLYFNDLNPSSPISVGNVIVDISINFYVEGEPVEHREFVTVYVMRGRELESSSNPNFMTKYNLAAGKTYRCNTGGLLKYTTTVNDNHAQNKVYTGYSKTALTEIASVQQYSSGSLSLQITDCLNIPSGTYVKCDLAASFYPSVAGGNPIEEIE